MFPPRNPNKRQRSADGQQTRTEQLKSWAESKNGGGAGDEDDTRTGSRCVRAVLKTAHTHTHTRFPSHSPTAAYYLVRSAAAAISIIPAHQADDLYICYTIEFRLNDNLNGSFSFLIILGNRMRMEGLGSDFRLFIRRVAHGQRIPFHLLTGRSLLLQ